MLNTSRQTLSPRADAEPGEHGPARDPGLEPALLDPAALASLRELDPSGKNQLLQRVCAAFESSTARLLPQMHEAHRNGDRDTVRLVAHTLKSSSASVGGKALSAHCAELEGRIRRGELADLDAGVATLSAEAERLLLALEQLLRDQR